MAPSRDGTLTEGRRGSTFSFMTALCQREAPCVLTQNLAFLVQPREDNTKRVTKREPSCSVWLQSPEAKGRLQGEAGGIRAPSGQTA